MADSMKQGIHAFRLSKQEAIPVAERKKMHNKALSIFSSIPKTNEQYAMAQKNIARLKSLGAPEYRYKRIKAALTEAKKKKMSKTPEAVK